MKSYFDISQEYINRKIPYYLLLDTNEWHAKRNKIISRENNICQYCKKSCIDDYIPKATPAGVIWKPGIYEELEIEKNFYCRTTGEHLGSYPAITVKLTEQKDPHFAHVHHTYYVLSNLPWNYPDEDLMLLCHKCHTKLHESERISVYLNKNQLQSINCTPCSRCGGKGHLPQFNYVEAGICFRCRGACFEEWV